MAVTGGHLAVIGDTVMIVGGHRFDGRYNPMGGPTFVQAYTNSVRRFTFDTTGGSLTIHDVGESIDEEHLHRRDYNLLPQVLPDGSHAFTIFSGVFQHDVDLPFLHPVDVTASTYQPYPSFMQYLNHYHSGAFSVVDSSSGEMHSFFLGGMSQYTVDDTGGLIRNDSVPFVTTIARVTRDAGNVFREHKLDVEFPDLEGSSAEFILFDDVPQTRHGVILGHRLTERTTDIGLLVGGIRSSAPNIFWVNDGTQSSASSTVYRVTLVKEPTSAVRDIEVRSQDAFTFQGSLIKDGTLILRLHLKEAADVYVRLYDVQGRSLEKFFAENSPPGDRRLELPLRDHRGPVLVAVQVNGQLRTFKLQ